jgi:hypothetical protein
MAIAHRNSSAFINVTPLLSAEGSADGDAPKTLIVRTNVYAMRAKTLTAKVSVWASERHRETAERMIPSRKRTEKRRRRKGVTRRRRRIPLCQKMLADARLPALILKFDEASNERDVPL